MRTETKTIVELICSAIEGKNFAFKELYDAFVNPMFNIALRMTGQREEAEDIVQESFQKAFGNLKSLKDKKMFGAWLRKIVVNASILRTKNKILYQDLTLHSDQSKENDDWFTEIDFERLHYAIKELPEGCRQIFVLYVSEDYSHKEIAALLSISESTSKSQYQRAKTLLKKQLRPNG